MAKRKKSPKTKVSKAELKNALKVSASLIVPRKKTAPRKGNAGALTSVITNALNTTGKGVSENKLMMRLLPDLEVVANITVGSVLAPKDLLDPSLHFTLDIPPDRKAPSPEVLSYVSNHFTNESGYNLLSKLRTILRDALFEEGAHASIILPAKTLEDFSAMARAELAKVHVTEKGGKLGALSYGMQSLQLAATSAVNEMMQYGLVSGDTKYGFDVCDNPAVLRAPETVTSSVSDMYATAVGTQSITKAGGYTSVTAGKTPDGEPLVLRVPMDSIAPVYSNGDTIGYYLLLDDQGRPVSKIQHGAAGERVQRELNRMSKENILGGILSAVGIRQSTDTNKPNAAVMLNEYENVLDAELAAQLNKSGVFGKDVTVSHPTGFARTMFYRALRSTKTRMLFVPTSLVAYYAHRRNEFGLGESLLESTKAYGVMRVTLLLAHVMSGVKASVGRTILDVTLDEDDNDPEATVSASVANYASYQTDLVSFNMQQFDGLAASLNRASLDVNVDGGDIFPGTKTELRDASRSPIDPDTDTLDELKMMQYMGIGGLLPELVSSVISGDTATAVTTRSELFAKTIIDIGDGFSEYLTEFVRNYIKNSELLTKKIKEGLGKDMDASEWIDSLRVKIPRPDLVKIKAQGEALNEFKSYVEDAIEAFVSEDMVDSLFDGDVDSRMMATIQEGAKGVIIRNWMAKQNMLPEMVNAFSTDGDVMGDAIVDHNNLLLDVLKPVLLTMLKKEVKLAKRMEKAKEDPAEEEAAAEAEANDPAAGGDDAGGETPPTDDAGGDASVEPGAADDGAPGGADPFDMG